MSRAQLDDHYLGAGVKLAQDVRGQLVILFPTPWALDYFAKEHPALALHPVSPHEA